MERCEFLGRLKGLPDCGIDNDGCAEIFTSVNHTVSDTADFAHIRQDSSLTVYKKCKQGMHRFMIIPQGRIVEESFPSLHIVSKQGVGHADTVCLALSQDAIALHLKKLVFE
jgi:hypothetical protein